MQIESTPGAEPPLRSAVERQRASPHMKLAMRCKMPPVICLSKARSLIVPATPALTCHDKFLGQAHHWKASCMPTLHHQTSAAWTSSVFELLSGWCGIFRRPHCADLPVVGKLHCLSTLGDQVLGLTIVLGVAKSGNHLTCNRRV